MIIKRKIWVNKKSGQKVISLPKDIIGTHGDQVFVGTKIQDVNVELLKEELKGLESREFSDIHLFILNEYKRRLV